MHVEQGRKKCEDKMPEEKNTPSIEELKESQCGGLTPVNY